MTFLEKECCLGCTDRLRVHLDIDRTVPMELVNAVKQEIRRSGYRHICYVGG